MDLKTIALLIFSLCIHPSYHAATQFMDCPGNEAGQGNFRVCCHDNQLPKDCECFDISSSTGYTNTLFHLPRCPSQMGVKFRVYTRSTRSGQSIRTGSSNIKGTAYRGNKKTYFITHGFTDSATSSWVTDMRNALLNDNDANVITVDWKIGATPPNYLQCVANTRSVGAMVGRLIQDLHSYASAGYNNFHLIGHSLGAHVMGYASKELKRVNGHRVGRITGLDPAGPNFEGYTPSIRLDKSDASFVDIIHTNGIDLGNLGFGTVHSIGHCDFYPNGGKHQPGCGADTTDITGVHDFSAQMDSGTCSHGRSIRLFTNSISKCRWNSPTAGATCTMGFHVSTSCRGDHYPKTTASQPFC